MVHTCVLLQLPHQDFHVQGSIGDQRASLSLLREWPAGDGCPPSSKPASRLKKEEAEAAPAPQPRNKQQRPPCLSRTFPPRLVLEGSSNCGRGSAEDHGHGLVWRATCLCNRRGLLPIGSPPRLASSRPVLP